MTTVPVRIETDDTNASSFRAISGQCESFGKTPGEALDALLAQEGADIESSAIFVQRFAPDAYFTQAQHDRMQNLLLRRTSLTTEESDELDALIDAELDATVARTDTLVRQPRS